MSLSKFQSTHSLRSATRGNSVEQRSVPCFNPRTPCGVRRMPGMMWPTATTFQSTHSLRSATAAIASMGFTRSFQSTHSLRSATSGGPAREGSQRVSIHALLAECDSDGSPHPDHVEGFNPRTPCGVRQKTMVIRSACHVFQSTHSLRSATPSRRRRHAGRIVSIHALLAECDPCSAAMACGATGFNPRTPCGVRPLRRPMRLRVGCFNPRTPCGVRQWPGACADSCRRFQSTHSLRSATWHLPFFRVF